MVGENSVAGPWGGQGGNAWSYVPKGSICRISISYGDVINTIRFTSRDESGNSELSNQFGSFLGSEKAEINVDAKISEKLIAVRGTFGAYYNLLVVTSLSFLTDKNRSYGPFGIPKGTAFTFKLDHDESIRGFHGRSGSFLDTISVVYETPRTKLGSTGQSGVNLKPKEKLLSVGPWGCQEPDNQWAYEPKGAISNISITHDDVIYSVSFTSQDERGSVDRSRTFGEKRGRNSDEIAIDIKNEKLNYISGTVDKKNGSVVVTSLSFLTDKKRSFGPFGTVRGTAFSLLAKDEGFVGFHGRSAQWLDAIGVYLKCVPEQRFGQWGSQEVGNDWTYEPRGAISHISLTHDDVINTICFTSKDDKGYVDEPKSFGWTIGNISSEVYIDVTREKLNSISGTFGLKSGYVVVTSLTFSTDKKRVFGPFGTQRGTPFSLRVNNGVFSGFYGRSGYWLDAIAVIVKPTE